MKDNKNIKPTGELLETSNWKVPTKKTINNIHEALNLNGIDLIKITNDADTKMNDVKMALVYDSSCIKVSNRYKKVIKPKNSSPIEK